MLNTLARTPSICVGIPTYLREQVLLDTLNQIFEQDDQPQEVIIADQTPEHEPEVATRLQALANEGRILWLRIDQPSLTAARNRILRESGCDYVLFLDDDILLPRDFVGRYRETLNSLAGIGVLSGGLSDRFSETPKDFRPSLTAVDEMLKRVRGGNQAVNRELALRIGGFDEQFVGPAHGEEIDFALRMKGSVGPPAYDGSLRLIHLIAPIGGCRVTPDFGVDWQKPMNLLLLAFRYPEPLSQWWWRTVCMALRYGPLLRANVVPVPRPSAWVAFLKAIKEAWRRRRSKRYIEA